MNTLQLRKILASQILAVHENVYASDQIPSTRIPLPASVIVNLDKSSQPGSHWISIYIDVQEKAEYFDSYGFPPVRQEFITFMRKNSKIWTYNSTALQDYYSDVCGQYCAVYLYFKTRHYTLKDFLSLFSSDRSNNDSVIKYLYAKIFLNKTLKTIFTKIVRKTPFIKPLIIILS